MNHQATQKFDVDDLTIDSNLVGGKMRDELIVMYNKLVYWSEQHSIWDAAKKELENLLEEVRDKAKALKAVQADQQGLKAKIQESFIRDFWSVSVQILDPKSGTIVEKTCSELNTEFIIASQHESSTRHKMNLCSTALDIGRTCVSWDKNELTKMGGSM